jgi:hypothetical protein
MLFYNPYKIDFTGQLSIIDVDQYTSLISFDNIVAEEIKQILEEEFIECQKVQDNIICADANLDELQEVFLQFDLIFTEDVHELNEGVAKRTVVVRRGQRKVIFKCKPGEKKIGRRCTRRNPAELNKMKRTAKIAARKAKTKKASAKRLRSLSLRKRKAIVNKK